MVGAGALRVYGWGRRGSGCVLLALAARCEGHDGEDVVNGQQEDRRDGRIGTKAEEVCNSISQVREGIFGNKKNKLIELQRSMQQLASANKALGQFKKILTECATAWADAAADVMLGSNMLKGR